VSALGSHTIEAWIRPFGQVTGGGIIAGHIGEPGGLCTQGFALQIDSLNRIGYVVGPSGCGNDTVLHTDAPISLDRWTHIAGTYDGGAMRFYVDGNLVSEKTGVPFDPATWMTAGAFDEAGGGAAGLFHYAGELTELRVWNYARSATDVQST